MGLFNKNIQKGRKRPTTGFSELNKRTYEASETGRSSQFSNNRNAFTNNSQIPTMNRNSSVNCRHSTMNNQNFQNRIPNSQFPGVQSRQIPSTRSFPNSSTSEYARNASQKKYADERHKKLRRKRLKIVGIILGSVIAALVICGIAFAAFLGNNMNEGMDDIGLTPTSLNEPFYMVLMGVDSSDERKTDGGTDNDFRSDSIILTKINPQTKKVFMISLHRDTLVDIEGHGKQKLNSAHSLGGPELVVKTVSKLAGVPINHYAEINFDGFKQAVDDLGGIVIDVPMTINDEYAGIVYAGHYDNLNGADALTLCRSRHSFDEVGDGDVYRAANQRAVLGAIAKKALSSDILTIAKTVTNLSKYIKTDLSINDMIGLAQLMKDINPNSDIYSAMMPTEGVYQNGVWYENLNTDKWNKMVERISKDLPPSEETIVDDNTGIVLANSGDSQGQDGSNMSGTVAVRNGTVKAGAANSANDKIKGMGFTTDLKDANTQDYTQTVIVYENDSQKSKAESIKNALGCGSVVKNNNEYAFSTDILVVIGTDYSD